MSSNDLRKLKALPKSTLKVVADIIALRKDYMPMQQRIGELSCVPGLAVKNAPEILMLLCKLRYFNDTISHMFKFLYNTANDRKGLGYSGFNKRLFSHEYGENITEFYLNHNRIIDTLDEFQVSVGHILFENEKLEILRSVDVDSMKENLRRKDAANGR